MKQNVQANVKIGSSQRSNLFRMRFSAMGSEKDSCSDICVVSVSSTFSLLASSEVGLEAILLCTQHNNKLLSFVFVFQLSKVDFVKVRNQSTQDDIKRFCDGTGKRENGHVNNAVEIHIRRELFISNLSYRKDISIDTLCYLRYKLQGEREGLALKFPQIRLRASDGNPKLGIGRY
jgi:hypothetical protein